MTPWKYTDSTNRVVSRVLDNGAFASCDVSVISDWIAQGNIPLPADPIPVVFPHLSPRQFRQALNQIGLRSVVDSAIAAADQNTKDWYEYSTYFDRNNPVTLAMAAQLGKTAADLDALWKLGATL